MRRAGFALVAVSLLLPLAARGHSQAPGEIQLHVVKRLDLQKNLEAFRGKIVVLDVWADFCPPCKREFPHLVELHEKFAGKDVACVSVSVDPVENKDDTLRFLKKQKATFVNYLLDEKQKIWQEHFGVLGPPAVFVYGRDGKLVKRFESDEEYTYADVEKLVVKLLAK